MSSRPKTPPLIELQARTLSIAEPSPSLTQVPVAPRIKKKIPWKGKTIPVLLPIDCDRGKNARAPYPLTAKEVEQILSKWEKAGYDTLGFNLVPRDAPDGVVAQGQSRATWPSLIDIIAERSQGSFKVNIPNKRDWDMYVQELQEAKLRALGVSIGSEEPSPSNVAPSLNRSTPNPYPPLPFSPPIPTSSTGSNHVQQAPFPPLTIPGAGLIAMQGSNQGSVASPLSINAPQGKFNPRQSISYSATNVEHPFGSPFQFPQQKSPALWSQGQMIHQQAVAIRGRSPSLQNFGALVSPALSFTQDGYFAQNLEMSLQLQQRQNMMQAPVAQPSLQLAPNRPSPRLQKVKEHVQEDGELSASTTLEARQIMHNSSASLQEEIDAAEYHLEGQIQRELEHEDYSPHFGKNENRNNTGGSQAHIHDNPTVSHGLATSRYAVDHQDHEPVLHHPQPHIRDHSLSKQPFREGEEAPKTNADKFKTSIMADKCHTSDTDLNSSQISTSNVLVGGAHRHALSASHNPWSDEKSRLNDSRHVSQMSTSKLNVAAKEFTFNGSVNFTPSTTFPPSLISRTQGLPDSSRMFPFNWKQFNPEISAYSASPPSVTNSYRAFHNQGPGSFGHFQFKNPAHNSTNSEIIFPSTNPNSGSKSLASAPLSFPTSSIVPSKNISHPPIFENIDFTGHKASRSNRKSKAIPIVRPDKTSPKKIENETTEGSDGRITRAEGHLKRVRGSKDDGSSIPLFAKPSPLQETDGAQKNESYSISDLRASIDKENLPPSTNNQVELPTLDSKTGYLDTKLIEPVEKTSTPRPLSAFGYESSKQDESINTTMDQEKLTSKDETSEYKANKTKGFSLSVAAEPFKYEASPNPSSKLVSQQPDDISSSLVQKKGLTPPKSNQAFVHPVLSSLPQLVGLSGSRFARSPTPTESHEEFNEAPSHSSSSKMAESKTGATSVTLSQPVSPETQLKTNGSDEKKDHLTDREPTFEEIDAVISQITKNEQNEANHNLQTRSQANSSNNVRCIKVPDLDSSSPIRLLPQDGARSSAPSPSPRRFQPVPGEKYIFTRAQRNLSLTDPAMLLNGEVSESLVPSEWDDMLTEGEEQKLESRAQFFDNHVNIVVGGILEDRLGPLEKTLKAMQVSIDAMAVHTLPAHRDHRHISVALSDADDEDDETPRQLLISRSERKFDRMKAIIQEALTSSEISRSQPEVSEMNSPNFKNILDALNEVKENISQNNHDSFGIEDVKRVVRETVETLIPTSEIPIHDQNNLAENAQQMSKIVNLEQKLLEVKEENKNQLVKHNEELRRAENKIAEEINQRRAAEDRLSEIQRQLRISSEEELRLRGVTEQKDIKIREILVENEKKSKFAEVELTKCTMRISILEAAQAHAYKSEADLKFKLRAVEADLHTARLELHRRQLDAENATETARRHSEDAKQATDTNKELRRNVNKLKIQLEESTRVRETMRGKLIGLQEDMARAAREIADESAKRVKKEQELIARHEVLDARLHAEGCTRERLEIEIERLEKGERDGLRAVGECRKLEALVAELREECHIAKKDAMRYQREFNEARESGLSEVQRTRNHMQADIEAANNQVNIVRETLEHQISVLRADIDQIKLEADTARERSEMLIEEAEMTKKSLISQHDLKLADTIEELQTKHQRQLQHTMEDAQRQEQHLLDRLSLSSVKTDHLQDRVTYLEEKLEIANATAVAAVAAAKTARSKSSSSTPKKSSSPHADSSSSVTDLYEKISPQALRESLMSLQKQLQERETTIESLTSTIASYDPDAASKISKRDHEIMWLRELLAVRKSDLSDIVHSLEQEQWDGDRIKDAAIRLRTNLQMQEQELERAMNGGSVLNIPNIAASLKDVASPRVAQAVGPLAAVWGNWRKGKSDIIAPPDQSASNPPSKPSSGILGGLLTPPASNIRAGSLSSQPPILRGSLNANHRFTSEQLANRPRVPTRGMPPKKVGLVREFKPDANFAIEDTTPKTPPIMSKSSYDQDAIEEEFNDAGFYEEIHSQGETNTLRFGPEI